MMSWLIRRQNVKTLHPHPRLKRIGSSFLKPETIQLGPVRRGRGLFLSWERCSDEAQRPGDTRQCPKTESSPSKGLWIYKDTRSTYARFVRILIFSASSILLDRLSPAEFLLTNFSFARSNGESPRETFQRISFPCFIFSHNCSSSNWKWIAPLCSNWSGSNQCSFWSYFYVKKKRHCMAGPKSQCLYKLISAMTVHLERCHVPVC